MGFQFRIAERAFGPLALIRWSMATIFILFGIEKFSTYAPPAIEPFFVNSPLISWLGVFGVVGEARIIGTTELLTAAALAIGSINPIASALGAAMASFTFILTTTFIITTPDLTLASSSGLPIAANLVGMFLIKDIALLGACLTLLAASLPRAKAA